MGAETDVVPGIFFFPTKRKKIYIWPNCSFETAGLLPRPFVDSKTLKFAVGEYWRWRVAVVVSSSSFYPPRIAGRRRARGWKNVRQCEAVSRSPSRCQLQGSPTERGKKKKKAADIIQSLAPVYLWGLDLPHTFALLPLPSGLSSQTLLDIRSWLAASKTPAQSRT